MIIIIIDLRNSIIIVLNALLFQDWITYDHWLLHARIESPGTMQDSLGSYSTHAH